MTSFLNKRSGTQFYRDWKPIKSIIDILHKNFQEDHTNSRRFPGVVDTLGYMLAITQYNITSGSQDKPTHSICFVLTQRRQQTSRSLQLSVTDWSDNIVFAMTLVFRHQ